MRTRAFGHGEARPSLGVTLPPRLGAPSSQRSRDAMSRRASDGMPARGKKSNLAVATGGGGGVPVAAGGGLSLTCGDEVEHGAAVGLESLPRQDLCETVSYTHLTLPTIYSV